jgi:cell shape-determining protein MreD
MTLLLPLYIAGAVIVAIVSLVFAQEQEDLPDYVARQLVMVACWPIALALFFLWGIFSWIDKAKK